jgi:carboxylesterase
MHTFKAKFLPFIGLSFFALLLTACGATQPKTSAQADTACLNRIEATLQSIDRAEDVAAAAMDPEQSVIRPGNESVVLRGNPKKVVFLLHGFISSPFEVRPLGEALHAQGYTVVMPLLAGFGRSTNVSVITKSADWMSVTQAQLQASMLCGSKIQVVGFSLGALIETKLLLENPDLKSEVASLTLISPALSIRTHSFMGVETAILNTVNSTPLIGTLATAARAAHNNDLNIPEANPEHYNVEMPMDAARELKILVTKINYEQFENFPMPVKVIYSEADSTVDGATGFQSIAAVDPGATAYAFPASLGVEHQLLLSSVQGVLETTADQVLGNFVN